MPVPAYAIVTGLLWRYPISRERQRRMRGIFEEREKLALRGAGDP